jgi:NADH-quinone oxidoreductase subunit C
MTEETNHNLIQLLSAEFGERVSNVNEPYGFLTFETTKDQIITVLTFLKKDERTNFHYLTDITAVHYPEKQKGLAVIYHLHNMVAKVRIRIKVFLDAQAPHIPTATDLWNGANWMEREC